MNKVEMMGRMVRDPEVRYSQGANATAVARFTIAVNRRYKREGEPDADFFSCVAFGKAAEFIEKYFKQGKMIAIVGRVENDNYTNKDGQKVYGTRISIDECFFCGDSNGSSETTTSDSNGGNKAAQKPKTDKNGFMDIPEGVNDELPFA